MKKQLLIFAFIATMFTAQAQNIQLHYDLGEGRNYFTSTVEMFKPDSKGYTFFFIDMDYDVGQVKGISLAYWELARGFNLGSSPFAWHAEYNGGFGQWKNGDASGAYTIEDALLTGFDYIWNAEDFSKGITLQALYKYIRGKHDASFQLTAVWYLNFANDKLSFSGFADFWREDMVFGDDKTKFVFLSEPQLWYNFNPNFSAGGEVEVAANFAGVKGWKLSPTIAVKYTF